MISETIQVTVNVEPDKNEETGYRFVSLKVGDSPSIPLPKDQPAPRRLLRDLCAAVAAAKSSTHDGG